MEVHGPVRLRLPQPGRGAAAHRRRRRDDPHEGRGRHRRRRRTRSAHMREVMRRHPAAAGALARGRAVRRGEEPPGAVRAGQVGGRERPAAGRHVHRGRHRDAGGRGDVHAVRRGRRLRRLGDLQVRRPVDRARRRSSRRRRTTTTRRCSPASPPGSARRWSASPPPRSRPSSCSRPAAGREGGAARRRPLRRVF